MKILRNKADRSTLYASGLAGALLIISMFAKLTLWEQVILVLLNIAFTLMGHVMNHNASHLPVFVSKKLNHYFFLYLSTLMGIPSAPIAASHIYNHHAHNNDHNDWMRSTVLKDQWGILRILNYIKHVFSLPKLSKREGGADIPKSLFLRSQIESRLILGLVVVLLAISPARFAIFYVLTRLIALCLLFVINLVQHDGLENNNGVNRCRNFISPIVNFFLFNNGYHSAHHLQPSAHWSELAVIHRKMVIPRIKPELNELSLFGFIFKNYVIPGYKHQNEIV
ncbi:MAG: fatty acid desaturase [Bacteriovoracaceae bacterium]|nr:fatty acid desaturase [Bacteriovoracaceae bacterium]